MSIIDNVERYMKRYDYLIQKRERRYSKGKRLSQEEDEELMKLKPTVMTPILVMFEVLHDTIKRNQSIRNKNKQTQTGGAPSPSTIAIAAVAATEASANAAGAATAAGAKDVASGNKDAKGETNDDEAQRLSELEESLLPLLTKIIVYIEQNKDKNKKKEEEAEEEKYPDIGTSVKNSAILVIRRIKKWWNDLIAGGSSDLSSKINLKKAIPQLANNPGDMNKLNAKAEELNALAEKATDAIDAPLKKIERIMTNDVRDIASSSVEGIMNALSLIPGIGTTLQLWRLLQNVIVIMSKSVTTMADAKKEGVELKENIQEIKGDVEALGDPSKLAAGAAGAAGGALPTAPGGEMPAPPDMPEADMPEADIPEADIPEAPSVTPPAVTPAAPAVTPPAAPAVTPPAAPAVTPPAAPAASPAVTPPAAAAAAAPAVTPAAAPAVTPPATPPPAAQGGGGTYHKSNHLRSIKKYKRDYKQSIREIRKTRKKLMKYMRNII
jgi:hypothetical protein